jgi:homoserine dehydrogenase
MDAIKCRYYIRLSVDDRPNVLARITHILGEAEISIASVLQNETDSDKLPVILITHLARESNVMSALSKIEALESVNDKPVLLRIEDI